VNTTPAPIVLATVGTDHHPFDRLVGWMEQVAATHPSVEVVVQYGHSRPPRGVARSASMLAYPDLQHLLETAAVVVCHGGPATIMEIRAAGHVPIVVPRRPELGEHVDGHQIRFTHRLGQVGHIHLAEEHALFARLVAEELAGPVRGVSVGSNHDHLQAVRTVGSLLDRLELSRVRRHAPGRPLAISQL
jgi:UDP-N-acetylglucosamine transferase subunit ALG13